MSTEPVSPEVFEPLVFWVEHKQKILTYATIVVIAIGGYGIYEFSTEQKAAESQALFASADSVTDFQNVLKKYPGTRVGGNAALELADKLRQDKKYDEAVATLKEFIAKYPQHPLLAGAWASLASTYEMQGKLDEAFDAYQTTASKFPDAFTTPIAMMAQARISAQKGKKDDARKMYQDVAARYQESVFGREAMREQRLLKK